MVEPTVQIEAENLIREICLNNVSYGEHKNIITFYRSLRGLKDAIKAHISDELYERFETEYQCVRNEQLYGDGGEDTDYVVNDCISVLDLVIDELLLKVDK